MARHDDGSIVCDSCGQSFEFGEDGSLPKGWRADSRYEYCPVCGPQRIRTMDELEAEAKASAKPR
jgi:uncharacterized Zn finger protein (UPF0148 family)